MTDNEILYIFVEVSGGRGRHGGFLMSFAEAVRRADPSNFALVRPVALLLISKYGLDKYLDNYEATRWGRRGYVVHEM
jgi:hypothetical protein